MTDAKTVQDTMQRFAEMLELPAGWDSYGAAKIDPRVVDEAMKFVRNVLGATSRAPRVAPLSSGGVQLEWRREGLELEVVFERNEGAFYYYRNRASGEEFEDALAEHGNLPSSIIRALEY